MIPTQTRRQLSDLRADLRLRAKALQYHPGARRPKAWNTPISQRPSVGIFVPWLIPNGGVTRVVDLVAPRLAALGWKVEVVETEPLPDGYSGGDRRGEWLMPMTTRQISSHSTLVALAGTKDALVNLGSPRLYETIARVRRNSPKTTTVDYQFNASGHMRSLRATARYWDSTWLAHDLIPVQKWMRRPRVVLAPVPPSLGPKHDGIRIRGNSPLEVLWVGRLSAEKDPLAFVRIASQLVGSNIHFTMIGDGPMLDRVSERASQLPNLTLRRQVRSVVRALHDSDVLAMTSRVEGIPLVLMEALAAGVPCMVPRVGGIPQIITTGTNGWIVPIESMAAALRVLGDSAEPLLTASQGAAQTDLSEMEPSAVSHAWSTALETLVAARRRRGETS